MARSGGDKRGNSKDRARRRQFLLSSAAGFGGNGQTVKCVWCPEMLTEFTVEADRIIPGSKGGRYTRDNIQPSCRHCNASRQDNDTPKAA